VDDDADGVLDGQDDEANTIDYPMFFCPFCGSKLQTPEQIDAKTSSNN
jgi:hypothetical protein